MVVPTFLPLPPSTWYPPSLQQSPDLNSCPWVRVSMVWAYKFFGFSISCTILNLPLSILYLPIMLPHPCTFSSFPLPTDNPPNDLHIYDAVPVLVVSLVCFCFLDSIVDSCEFVVILMITALIFFFLTKSL